MDIHGIDLNLLKVLDALLAETSVSGAARRLRLSQPATSAALSRLRRLLDDPLLIRRGNAMIATARAEELRPRIAGLLDEIARSFDRPGTFVPGDSSRRFRILASEYAVMVLLGPLAMRLSHESPGITLELLPFDPRFEERLANHDADLAISRVDLLHPGRNLERLISDSYVSVVRKAHPRLSGDVSVEAFVAEQHAMITSVGRAEGDVDRALGKEGLRRHVALTLPHYLVAPEILAGSDLIMTVPRRIAAQFCTVWPLRMFSPPINVKGFEVAAAWHPRSAADPAIVWLLEALKGSYEIRTTPYRDVITRNI
ncbi:LysR family transcriptional regulator [Rhizobium sp. AB2/73]|uniref:LysR family transcriptional regulator n=1 Tax=Rhizobium sp. AB2/73 TaxID=2795216 RepID=UPI001C5CC72C|nr:LysR family transcriptional regulator [Rhizobium sp. AB2/73]QYA13195.1 LysR family transcriptional regulator [Rhizobium sp. AB2/73]UEQ80872.1 LysR family transcriptional regulator [Rhizobium sp. AB2/73]